VDYYFSAFFFKVKMIKPIFIIIIVLSLFSQVFAKEVMVWVAPGEKIVLWPNCVKDFRNIPGSDIYRVNVNGSGDDCIKELKKLEKVIFIEEDQQILISDSLLLSAQEPGDICDTSIKDAFVLNALGKGGKIVAAVIDTGISLSMYTSSLKKNFNEIPGDGIDNDLNGYIDDYDGWDFGDMDSDPEDILGHGTQVSSILLNIAPDLMLVPIKVNQSMDTSFSTANAAEAIFYAVAAGVDIINMSFSTKYDSFAINTAVKYALDSGIIVVAAAGNSGADVEFPANMDGVIAVGSFDMSGNPSWFSPVGDALDILGPGENVCAKGIDGKASQVSGTSFSTPYIAGAAAVLMSMNKYLKPDTIKKILYKGSTDILDPGWDIYSGSGVINTQALTDVATPSIIIPDLVLKGSNLSVEYYLPQTDIITNVFIALIYDNITWWLDSDGKWHRADQVPYSNVIGKTLTDFETNVLFGSNGLFDVINTGSSDPGKYLLAIGIFDKKGDMLAPLGWTEVNIYL